VFVNGILDGRLGKMVAILKIKNTPTSTEEYRALYVTSKENPGHVLIMSLATEYYMAFYKCK
jgi:hypothetical protein